MFRFAFLASVMFPVLAWGQSTSYVAAAGYSFPAPTAVAPGQIVTLFVRGLNVPNAAADTVPLPRTMSGVRVVVKNPPTPNYPTSLPIFSVRSSLDSCAGGLAAFCNTTAVTVQFPFEPTCIPSGGIPNECTIGQPPPVKIAVQTDAGVGQEFWLSVVSQFPHVLNSCDAIFGIGGVCHPFVTHADGSLVSTGVPARPGEVVTLYAVGLGQTQSGATTGSASVAPDPIIADFYLSWGYFVDVPPGSPAPPPKFVQSGQWIKADFAGLVKGYVGLYQINVRVPDVLPEGIHRCDGFADANVRFLVGPAVISGEYKEAVDICVRQ